MPRAALKGCFGSLSSYDVIVYKTSILMSDIFRSRSQETPGAVITLGFEIKLTITIFFIVHSEAGEVVCNPEQIVKVCEVTSVESENISQMWNDRLQSWRKLLFVAHKMEVTNSIDNVFWFDINDTHSLEKYPSL